MDDLTTSIKLMQSLDYKDRFKAEYLQVATRYYKLEELLLKWDTEQLDFVPTCPRSIYDKQLKAMREYKDILEERAEIEGIDLNVY